MHAGLTGRGLPTALPPLKGCYCACRMLCELSRVHEASDRIKPCENAFRAYWQGHAHGAPSMKGCCSACRTLCSQAPQEARSSI